MAHLESSYTFVHKVNNCLEVEVLVNTNENTEETKVERCIPLRLCLCCVKFIPRDLLGLISNHAPMSSSCPG
jgi:hypothetical protein